MRDVELERRINVILTKLQLLSEVDSASIVSNDGGGASKLDSAAPPGARPDMDRDQPPPKDRSLYEWYGWHFARASDDARRRLLCYLAERDYTNVRHRRPHPRGKTGPEDERNAMRRIVNWYEGVDALEVAVLEGVSTQHVHKARRIHKRRPYDGRLATGWSAWTQDQKRERVNKLRVLGRSRASVAREFEVSPRTISRYWGA